MPMQIPSNVLARVLISVDLCGMSQLACSFAHFCGSHQLPPRLQPTKNHISNCYLLVSHMVYTYAHTHSITDTGTGTNEYKHTNADTATRTDIDTSTDTITDADTDTEAAQNTSGA